MTQDAPTLFDIMLDCARRPPFEYPKLPKHPPRILGCDIQRAALKYSDMVGWWQVRGDLFELMAGRPTQRQVKAQRAARETELPLTELPLL